MSYTNTIARSLRSRPGPKPPTPSPTPQRLPPLLSYSLLLFLSLSVFTALPAQNPAAPKREFRAVWVATAFNIDYPRRPTDWEVALREEYKRLLDRYERIGFNAVILQVRVAGDALYPSELAPWSRFLTGKQGRPPADDFDPLAFYVEETHRRGMEFHAWFNPLRGTTGMDTLSLAPTHAFNRHRNWLLPYGGKFYFNPARNQVREHIVQVVGEVVANYDIDAVHFDDYFYPYRYGREEFPDTLDYQVFGAEFDSIGDWRRYNINQLISEVSAEIKRIKPHVKFGVSPFGVWRNADRDRGGSQTRASATAYDDLYADVLGWLRRQWIDYVIPQLYWHIGFPPADHETLLKWWSVNNYNRHLYVGHAAYKIQNSRELAWYEAKEIPSQIRLSRRNFVSAGSAFFSSDPILQNRLGVRDSLEHFYRHPALIPEMPELGQAAKGAPDLRRVGRKKGLPRLKWKPAKRDEERPPYYYVVYRFEGDEKPDFEDGANILHVTGFNQNDNKKIKYIDETAEPGKKYTYVITAVNRQHSESPPSRARRIEKTEKGLQRLR